MNTLIWKLNTSEGFEEDALQEVLAIEKQAQGILRDADAEAQRIIAEAREKAQELKAAAETEAKKEAHVAGQKSLEDLEQQIHSISEQANRDAETWFRAASTHYEAGLAYVLERVAMSEAQEA